MLALVAWTNACVGDDPINGGTSTNDGGSVTLDGTPETDAPDATAAHDFSFEPETFDVDPGQTVTLRVRGSPELASISLVLVVDPMPDAGVPATAVTLGASSVSLATGDATFTVQAAPNAPQQRFRIVGTAGSLSHEARGRITGRPGELDVFFGDRGGYFEIAPGGDSAAYAVAVQPDGRFVVVGKGEQDDRLRVVRFTPDGALDTSFGADGKGFVMLAEGNRPRVLLMPDGAIAIGAHDFSIANAGVKLFRVDASGTPDPAWGGESGITAGLQASPQQLAAIGRLGDVLFAAGNAGEQSAAVKRYLPDAGLDPSFGNGGTVTFSLDPRIGKQPYINAIEVEESGIYWIAGAYRPDQEPTRQRTLVRRFRSDGTDHQAYVADTYSGGATALALQSGKAIVGAFDHNDATSSKADVVVFRVTNDLDKSFGTDGGTVVATRTLGSFPSSIVVDASDRIYLVDAAHVSENVFEVFRLLPNGALDSSFGKGGVFQLPTGRAYGAVIVGRQMIVVGANDAQDPRFMRIARIWL